MSFVRTLKSLHSDREFDPFEVEALPEADSRPIEMVLDLERIRSEYPDFEWYQPKKHDMWRFGPLMPLNASDPEDAIHIVSLGEGSTPMLRFDDHPVAKKVGFRLGVKDEGAHHEGFGANPTLSFKDRGMAVVVSMARRLGIQKLAIPTQGNAGDSLVAYALAGDLDVAVVAPDDTPLSILGRLAAEAKRSPSVHLDLVSGTIREAAQLVRESYVSEGYYNVGTFQEPGWRIEGKKTFGLELAEPDEPGGAWSLPDVVIYPTGGGTGIIGMWKAFAELEQLGVIGPDRPRVVAVQADATAPVVRAYESGADDVDPMEPGRTIAAGLNVPYSTGHRRVLEILRESDGRAVAVSDDAIRDVVRTAFRSKGWWLCPEGAACIAVLQVLVDEGVVRRGDDVVAFNTASLEKYLPAVREAVQEPWERGE